MKLNKRKIKKLKVLVLGDHCIDKFFFGEVKRISPEGPIPIVNVERIEERLGMAGNVAVNLQALGCQVTTNDLLGNHKINQLLISYQLLDYKQQITGVGSETIYKNRLVANNQIVYRFDLENVKEPNRKYTDFIFEQIKTYIKEYDAIVLCDYGKQFFNENLIVKIIELCLLNDIPCFVEPDTKKPLNTYYGANLIKLNEKQLNNYGVVLKSFKTGISPWNGFLTTSLVVTLGKEGMLSFNAFKNKLISSKIDSEGFVDAIGAGDVALASLIVSELLGYNIKDRMYIANVAAGLSTKKVGTTVVTLEELNKNL